MKKMEPVAEGRITKLGKAAHPFSERSSRGHQIFCLLSLVIIFGLGGLAYAESDDALFIDQNGNIGIGRQTPRAKLDVNGAILGIGMVPPGGIVMFSGDIDKSFDADGTGRKNTPYEGWQLCNGKNGAPDLRGRFVLGAGQGPNLTNRVMGQSGGEETHILADQEIPIHDHQATIPVYKPLLKSEKIYHAWNSSRTYCYRAPVTKPGVKTTTAGEGKAHNNMPPFYTLALIMRLP